MLRIVPQTEVCIVFREQLDILANGHNFDSSIQPASIHGTKNNFLMKIKAAYLANTMSISLIQNF